MSRIFFFFTFGFLALTLTAEDRLMNQSQAATKLEQAQSPQITVQTSLGDFTVELFPKVAPKTCQNFVELAEKHYYDGVIFHRVIKNFMIQGGDPTGTGSGGKSIWDKPFADEFSPSIKFDGPGVLAMANSGPNTNGSQFFITTVPCPWLNNRHTIFGKVVSGMDTIKKIEETQVGPQDRPVTKVVINAMKLLP